MNSCGYFRIIKYFFVLLFLLSEIAFAQFYFFGRNKVQYDKFDWRVLRTDNFDIYYYNETEEIAEIGAYYAEEIYDELKVKLNHVVTRRVPLIFYNTHLHFQQTNTTPGFIPEGVGGFFEFIKGRVVIPSTGNLAQFRHVIRHELVHVFMVNKVYKVLADRRMPSDVLPPLWFVEGIAEYLSTEEDAQARMVMRDAVINNYFVGIENIYSIFGSFLMYKEGQNFLEFVEEKYGKEKIPLFLENFWMNNNFNKVIEHTLGKTIKEIDNEWTFHLKRKYYPLMASYSPIENGAEKLTDFGFNFAPAAYEKDGIKYLFFVGNRDGYSSLFRMQIPVEGEEPDDPKLIVRGEKTEEFESFHLFQSSIDVSENGIISFITKSGRTDAIHFYSIDRDEVIKTFQRDNLINIRSPKFSSDGTMLVFNAVDQKGFSDIFTLNIFNNEFTRLTNDYYDDMDPSFGLTDNQILFSSDRTAGEYEKKYNIFSYDLISNSIEYITYLDCNNSSPVLSPDNNKLMFISEYDGVGNLWELEVDNNKYSGEVNQVTHYITSIFNPSFVDNSSLVFSGFEKFSFNLYKLNLTEKDSDVDSSVSISMEFDAAIGKWEAEKLAAHGEKEKLDYEKDFTLDYAQSQISTDPVFGTRGGAVLSLSDLLGDDNFFFLIYNTAEVQSDILKSFNVAIQRINLSERANYGYGVFHFSGRRYDIRDSDEFFYERSYGGFFLLSFPLSKFQRIEASASIANSDKQVITGVIERKALLLTNSLSWVMDNSLWGPTGPLDGTRARLLLGYTGDVKFSNVNYFTLIADYRHYFRLGFRSALAFRSALFYNEGKEARRYFMGGSWDLRGWPRWSIRGEKLWLSSLELRIPLIDQVRISLPFMNLGFFGIRGAAFIDAGGAWDEEYRSTLGSVGGGIRMNLFGALVLRYDIGKKIENNLSSFQDGLFYQFFFGWDF
jgi:Tol biopolymer transport system component